MILTSKTAFHSGWKRWAIAAAVACHALPAGAVVVNNATAVNQADPALLPAYSSFPYWNNVGQRNNGAALYLGLGGNFMLAPKHVNAGNTALGGITYTLDNSFTPVQLRDAQNNLTDLILYKINGDHALPSVPIKTTATTASTNTDLLMTGWGFLQTTTTPRTWDVNTATNPDTWTEINAGHADDPNLINRSGYTTGNPPTLQWGTNRVAGTRTDTVSGLVYRSFYTTFSSNGTAYEAQTVNYDSGGTMFLNVNGVWQAAGMTWGLANVLDGQPGGVGTAILNSTQSLILDLSYYRDSIYNALVAANQSPPTLWNVAADGNWSTLANWFDWFNAVPNAVGATVKLQRLGAGNRTLTLDGSGATVGSLTFDSTQSFTITPAAAQALTLDVASGNAVLNVLRGSHAIAAELRLKDHTLVTVAGGASLNVSGKLINSNAGAGLTLTKSGTGTLNLSGAPTWGSNAQVVVQAGSLVWAVTSSTASVGLGASLTIDPGASAQIAGSVDPLSDGVNRVSVVNHSSVGLTITAPAVNTASVTGDGTTTVAAGGSLTTRVLRQHALVINGLPAPLPAAVESPAAQFIDPFEADGDADLSGDGVVMLLPEPGTLALLVLAVPWLARRRCSCSAAPHCHGGRA